MGNRISGPHGSDNPGDNGWAGFLSRGFSAILQDALVRMGHRQYGSPGAPGNSVTVLNPKGINKPMTFSQIVALIAQAFITYETDMAVLEAGGTATSPQVTVGSVQGKPLYASVVFSTTKG